MSPILTVVVSFASALLATIVSPLVVFRLNERQRQLELYKISYPEKFKAIREFMATAYDLEIDVINANNGRQAERPDRELIERIKRFRREADANQWLFGVEIVESVSKIYTLMMDATGPRTQLSSDIELLKAFRELNLKVGDELHTSKLRKVFLR